MKKGKLIGKIFGIALVYLIIVTLAGATLSLALMASPFAFPRAGEVLAESSSWSIQTVDSAGDVGVDTSLAFDTEGNPTISYYDSTNGDLKYAYWNGTSWHIQTVDSGGDVGQANCLAFDAAGNPAVVYYDATNRALKYGHWNGASWDICTVDGAYWSYRNSLVFDASARPAIAYYDYPACDLKYAEFNGTSWNKQTVYDDGLGTGWGRTTSLTLDSSGNPAIAIRHPTVGLRYAHWNGTSWNIETVDSGYGTGAAASLRFDPLGTPAIAYWWQGAYKGPTGLRYAHYNGTTWDIETLDDSGSPSLAFDPSGNPAMSYYYVGTNIDLKYAHFNGTTWDIETVDSQGNVGQHSSLAFNSFGNPAISYYDATNGDLRYAFGLGPDTTPPTVVSRSPEAGTPDVPIETLIRATFSEAMDGSTINASSFTLVGSAISGTVTYNPVTYTANFTPDANLDYDHQYTATLSTAITDLAGNPLAEPCTWSFTTKAAPPGYAIIVAGQAGWPEKRGVDHAANNAYRVLRNLGFDENHIFYLNSNNSQPQDVKVDDAALHSHFKNKVEEIKNKMGDNPVPLIIFLVGHGERDFFEFDKDAGTEGFLFVSRSLPPIGLQQMLDTFSSQTPMLLVIGSCYSGTFITSTGDSPGSISAENRIIITAAHDGLPSGDPLWFDVAWFSDRFWENLNEGHNVKEAFTEDATASDVTYRWLDDNGDRRGHAPHFLGDDGDLAAATTIGVPGTEDLDLTDWYLVWKHSPGELRVYDSQNRVTGLVNGEAKQEIPDSIYDEENEIVGIFSPSDSYHYQVVGTDEGIYGLDIASIEDGEATTFVAIDIPTTTGAVHQYTIDWDALAQGEEGVTVQVDSDGDGEFEDTFTSDEELTGDEFISQLQGCFIATAAYGTPMAEETKILREFRDGYLLTNPLGQAFVDFYYRVSPPIAEFITEHPSLKSIVRAGLVPAVAMSTVAVNTTVAEKMAIVGLLVIISVAVAIWEVRRRRRGPKYT